MADLPSSVAAVDALKTLSRVLIKGNSTGGTNLVVSPSDLISGQDNPQGSLLHLRGGDSSSGGNSGANVRIEGGGGDTTGNGGNVVVRGGAGGASGSPGVIQMTNNGGDDTAPVYSIASEGTNGATINFFVGDQDPTGVVPALGAGDTYFQNDGNTYRSTASGTGNWVISSGGIRRVLDSRSSPHTSPLVSSGGGTAQNTIDTGAPNCNMLFILVTASVSVTADIVFYSDVARTKSIFGVSAHDFTTAYVLRIPTFLMANDGTDLESNSIHYTITNNGGADATFDISLVLEGV